MPEAKAPQVVRSYLSQLATELADLPSDVRTEIVAGIREELHGLDSQHAAARIEELGDPEFIATEARAESGIDPAGGGGANKGPTATPLTAEGQGSLRRVKARRKHPQAAWYPTVTVLLIIGGGFVIPVIGWVIGVTMLWGADVWNARDKWRGTLAGPLAILVSGVTFLAIHFGLGNRAGAFDPVPLMLLVGILLPTVANVIVGIRLLRQARQPA